MIDLFRYKCVRTQAISTNIICMLLTVIFFGVTFALSGLGLDIYTNSLIVAFFETAGYAVNAIMITRAKRKTTVVILFIVITVIGFLYLFIKTPDKSDKIMN